MILESSQSREIALLQLVKYGERPHLIQPVR